MKTNKSKFVGKDHITEYDMMLAALSQHVKNACNELK
jgi:hypothetical protein